MVVISYLEIEPLKLNLQTKKKFKSQVSRTIWNTQKKKKKESRVSDGRPAQNILENLEKKKKKKKKQNISENPGKKEEE